MAQHGGKLTATSDGLGLGSTFTVSLPLYHIPDSELPPSLKHLRLQRSHLPKRESPNEMSELSELSTPEHLRILIVDDAALNRKLLSRLLTKRNHTCEQAEDGAVAVDMVKKAMEKGACYDSILLDYEMPNVNGPSAAAEIRKLGCDAFIVGITGNVLPDDVAHFKNCGANAVFPKPLELSLLEAMWIEYGVLQGDNPQFLPGEHQV